MQNQDDERDDERDDDEEKTSKDEEGEKDSDDEEDKKDDEASDDEDDDATLDEEIEKELLEMDEEEAMKPENQEKILKMFKASKSTIKQKQVWRERAEAAGYGKKKPEPKPKAAQHAKPDQIAHLAERSDFRADHPELRSTHVNEIERYATANKMTLEQAFKKPLIQTYLKERAEKKELLDASPSSKHRGKTSAPSTDWGKASKEDLEKKRLEILSRSAR